MSEKFYNSFQNILSREVCLLRRFLGLLAFSVVAVVALAGGTAKFILGVDITTLLPADTPDNPTMMVEAHIFEGLVQYDPEMNIVPVLAERWEISEDGKTYTFHLRKDVLFHDGTPFNAYAVKKNFEYILNSNLRMGNLYKPNIERVDVVDEYTVQFVLKFPFAPFINYLCHPAGRIVSPKAIDAHGSDPAELGKHPSGTGPFELVEWVPGEHVVLRKNENYWRRGYPKLDGIKFVPVPEAVTRVLQVQSGDADLAVNVPAVLLSKLEKDPRVDVVSMPTLRVIFLGLNLKRKPFDDIRVRKALNYAVDKETLCKTILRGLAVPLDSPISRYTWGYASVGGYPYNPEKAKELLKEAGYPNGFEMEILTPKGRYPQDYETAVAIQSMLEKVGIKVKVVTTDWPSYVARVLKTENYDAHLLGWSPSTGEAFWAIQPMLGTGGVYNRSFYSNPKVDQLLEDAKREPDTKRQLELLAEVQKSIMDDAPWVFLYNVYQVYAKNSELKGEQAIPTELIVLNDAYFEE